MKSTILYGAYGGVNAGDEYILKAMSEVINEPNLDVICESTKWSGQTLASYSESGINPISIKNIPKVMKGIYNSNLVIGGGQVVNGGESRKSLVFLCVIAILNRIVGNKPKIIAAGVGNISQSAIDGVLVKILTNVCYAVTVRDQNSYDKVRKCGGKVDEITADIVFTQGLKTSHNADKILVCIHNSPHTKYQDIEKFSSILKYLYKSEHRDNVVLVAHDSRLEFDVSLLERTLENFPFFSKAIPQTFSEVDELYKTASCVISSRMHPLIIGSLYGATLFNFGGSDKIKDLASKLLISEFSPENFTKSEQTDSNGLSKLIESSNVNKKYIGVG